MRCEFKILANQPNAVRHTFRFLLLAAPFQGVLMCMFNANSYIALSVLNASGFQVALIKSAQIGSMLLSIYWGAVAMRHRKARLIFWTLTAGCFWLAAIGLIPQDLILFGRFDAAFCFTTCVILTSIIFSTLAVSINSIYRSNYPYEKRSQLVAATRIILFIVSAACAALASAAIDRWDWTYRLVYPVTAVAGIATGLCFRRIMIRGEARQIREFRAKRRRPFRLGKILSYLISPLVESAHILRRDRPFRNFMTGFFIFGFANLMGMPLYELYFKQELGLTTFQGVLAVSIIPSIAIVLCIKFWGRFIDRNNIFICRALLTGIWLLEPFCYLVGHSFGWVIVAKIATGCAMGGGQLIWAVGVLGFAPRDQTPLYIAIHTSLVGFRGLAAPLLGVFLYEQCGIPLNFMFGVIFAMMVISIIHLLVTGWDYKRQRD